MILGHGIDLQAVEAIRQAVEKRPRFASRVLTASELAVFEQLSGQRRYEYLAGRWAAKEAFAKAMGTGIGKLKFLDLEVLADDKGAPYFSRHPFEGRVWLSISHSAGLAQASVILETP